MKLNDEMSEKVVGGSGNDYESHAFSIGDEVTMIGKVGIVTEIYYRHYITFYTVHWYANEYGPEEDQYDIPETLLLN